MFVVSEIMSVFELPAVTRWQCMKYEKDEFPNGTYNHQVIIIIIIIIIIK